MKRKVLTSPQKIVQEIISDMLDRAGFDDLWRSLDPEVQEEIVNEWEHIVREGLRK